MNSSMKWCLFELNDVLLYLVWLYMLKVASYMYFYALDDNFRVKLNQTRKQSLPDLTNSPRQVESSCKASYTLMNSLQRVHSELRASCPAALWLSLLWARPRWDLSFLHNRSNICRPLDGIWLIKCVTTPTKSIWDIELICYLV
jgi:hypothetical protein